MSADRELLELAAKAAGIPYTKPHPDYDGSDGLEIGSNPMRTQNWNPLADDGDALRLAVKLRMFLDVTPVGTGAQAPGVRFFSQENAGDTYAASRRAIVRAAAEIGKAMP